MNKKQPNLTRRLEIFLPCRDTILLQVILEFMFSFLDIVFYRDNKDTGRSSLPTSQQILIKQARVVLTNPILLLQGLNGEVYFSFFSIFFSSITYNL